MDVVNWFSFKKLCKYHCSRTYVIIINSTQYYKPINLNINFIPMNRPKPYLNKFTLQKELQITDTYHQLNMKHIKPISYKHHQHTPQILINRNKQHQIKEDREIEIERENQALLQRMSSVINKQGAYSPHQVTRFTPKTNRSLNQIFRKKQGELIALQNHKQKARINSQKPTLNLQQIDRDWRHNKGVIKKMSNCQFYMSTFRPKETHYKSGFSSSIELKEKISGQRISKTMILDGLKMLVQIEQRNGFLKIRADLIGQKKYQVIDIPAEDAIAFVRNDCAGSIRNIFQKLRYDAQNQVLYVVGTYQNGHSDANQMNPETNIEGLLQEKPKVEADQQQQLKKMVQEVKNIENQNPVQRHNEELPAKPTKYQEQKVKEIIQSNIFPLKQSQSQLHLKTSLKKEEQPLTQQNKQPQQKSETLNQHQMPPFSQIVQNKAIQEDA